MTWALILASARQVALEKVNTQEKNLTDFDKESFNMPLNGEYEPSPSEWVRRQVELYEATNGVEGGTQNGKPVIVLTSQGAKSGKIRKIPLMRIEHNGVYAVSLLMRARPSIRSGITTSLRIHLSNCRTARSSTICGHAKSSARKRPSGGSGPTPRIQNSPITGPVQAAKFRCSL